MADGNTRETTPSGGLSTYLSPLGAWAFALGTSIGWGSLVVTSNTYLSQAGPLGSVLGLVIGMGIMLVIAGSYHFMMVRHPSAGGLYSYARDLFGYDHGVLVAWFLILTYLAMFWANATSLQLFARFFVGDVFQFGFHYQLFGYDIYMGETLLTMVVIVLAGVLCISFKRGASRTMTVLALAITVGISVCFAVALLGRDAGAFPFSPAFQPGSSALGQVVHVACISSWAFIGFESVSYSVEGFNFPRRHSFKVLSAAIVVATALYCFLILLSITAYPEHYGSWVDYIKDLGNNSGIAAIPAFYAANYYLGGVGVAILTIVLLALVLTSLIGNIVALSRLLYTLGQDEVIPASFGTTNEHGVPARAIMGIVAVSLVVPFFGRTAIGWIVDVTTLCATIVYGFLSACAIQEGRTRRNRLELGCGVVGLALMVVFAVYLLLPGFLSNGTMATESYFLFTVWGVLGFLFFRRLLHSDANRRFGKSIITWLALLTLVLFTSLAWMGQSTEEATRETIQSIQDYYAGRADPSLMAMQEDAFLAQAASTLDNTITRSITLIAGLFMFSLFVMLSNFNVMQRREEESHKRAASEHRIANTDPLTGVKNKNAYVTKEAELNEQLEDGALEELAVAVCDVNGLKQVNDIQGHKAGDEYIQAASKLICDYFKHSPVYRIGGDEFAVLLQGVDFANREQIMAELNREVEGNRDAGKVVVSVGISDLMPAMDHEIHAVFERADAFMYQRKRQLKGANEEIR